MDRQENIKKLQDLERLIDGKIWKDFNKIQELSDLLQSSNESEYLVFWNEKTLLEEVRFLLNSIQYCEYSWAEDMKYYEPKRFKKLVRQIKYYLNKKKGVKC